jgi:peptide/nickel transport system permease protein
LGQDYIRTARAKGLSDFKSFENIALKNSLNRWLLSGWFASMLAGRLCGVYILDGMERDCGSVE